MIKTIDPGRNFHVTGDTKSQIEDDLSTAVVLARQQAPEVRQGILVTRHAPGSYTVALTPTVPYGVTEERDA